MSLSTPGGEQLRVGDTFGTTTAANYVLVQGRVTGAGPIISAQGSDTNVAFNLSSKGTNAVVFNTNNGAQSQMQVSHTASAVNYVQVTGAATGFRPSITLQGSDANIGLNITTKGTFGASVRNSAGSIVFSWDHSNTATENYIAVVSSISTGAPSIIARGTGTDIDLTLTPKGTGNVRFGTFTTLGAEVITGYIEVKDSGGTIRKLAVIA
jgi:hypothetical protein